MSDKHDSLMTYSSSGLSTEQLAIEMINNAKLANLKVDLQAGLAKQALSNTAMLATAEEKFAEAVPSATNELHAITQSYAYWAITHIVEGG